MTDQLQVNNNLQEIISSRRTENTQFLEHKPITKGCDLYKDTLSMANQGEKNLGATDDKPNLEPPKQQHPSNFIMAVAAAFGKSFDAMQNGVVEMTSDYTQMSDMCTTMSACVLQSTNLEITKQTNELQLAEQIQAEEKKMSDSPWHWILFGLGAAIMIACFVSGFFTGGATDAALPEVAEVTVGAEEGAAEGGAEGAEEGAEEGADADDVSNAGNDGSSTSASDTNGAMNSQTDESLEESDEQVTNSKADEEKQASRLSKIKDGIKSRLTSPKWLGKRLLGMGLSGLISSANLVTGIQDLQIHKQLDQLSGIQISVGNAQAIVQKNNSFYQFYQNLVQREGGVLDALIQEAGGVVQTFGQFTSAVQQISYGLASAA